MSFSAKPTTDQAKWFVMVDARWSTSLEMPNRRWRCIPSPAPVATTVVVRSCGLDWLLAAFKALAAVRTRVRCGQFGGGQEALGDAERRVGLLD